MLNGIPAIAYNSLGKDFNLFAAVLDTATTGVAITNYVQQQYPRMGIGLYVCEQIVK